MARRYFGTDGVRGRVGESADHARVRDAPRLCGRQGPGQGRAWPPGGAAGQGHPDFRLHAGVGPDGRASARPGWTCTSPGPLPTPAVAYLTRALRLSAGRGAQRVAQSVRGQRHQVLLGRRQQAAGRDARKPSRRCWTSRWSASTPSASARRSGSKAAAGRYIEFCKSTFPFALDLKGLKLVVDCANGAAYHTAPHVFHELGAEVVSIGTDPNGININDGVGAVHPQGDGCRGPQCRRGPRHLAGRRRRPADHVRCGGSHLRWRRTVLRPGQRPPAGGTGGRRRRHAHDQLCASSRP